LRIADGRRRFDLMRWQLVPATEPAFSTKLSTINARSESVFESPLYREIVLRRRCIVPISGFFEWKKAGGRRQPFRIFQRDESIMSVAGIWDSWRHGTADARHSFSILTTSANDFMSEIHARMPVILSRTDEDAWLDPENADREQIQHLLKPCPSSWLASIPVSPLVNATGNKTPAVLDSFAAEEPLQRTITFLTHLLL
jgi:putative SOS response-associated peptidase YedK